MGDAHWACAKESQEPQSHSADLDVDSKEESANEELFKEPGILVVLFMHNNLGGGGH